MSTNYYHRTNICHCCNRFEQKHIGKYSCGSRFLFQATNETLSFEDWKKTLGSGGIVVDELNHKISLVDLMAIIDTSRNSQTPGDVNLIGGFTDKEGWPFTNGNWS